MKLNGGSESWRCCEPPHASMMERQDVRGSLFRTSYRELGTVPHRIRTPPRCSVLFVSQIHSPVGFYGTRPSYGCR
jgi:hypothetical protein